MASKKVQDCAYEHQKCLFAALLGLEESVKRRTSEQHPKVPGSKPGRAALWHLWCRYSVECLEVSVVGIHSDFHMKTILMLARNLCWYCKIRKKKIIFICNHGLWQSSKIESIHLQERQLCKRMSLVNGEEIREERIRSLQAKYFLLEQTPF